MNNNPVDGKNYPSGSMPQQPVSPQQPVRQPVMRQPVPPQQPVQQPAMRQPVMQQPVPQPVMRQPVIQQPVPQPVMRQPVMQQPVPQPVMRQPVQQPMQSVPQPVRPVYQQPVITPQPIVRPVPQYTVQARQAVGSMNKALFVLLSVLFGWICSRSVFSANFGIGMTVAGISFYLIYIPFLLFRQKKKFSLFGWLLFIPQIVILASFSFFSGSRAVVIGLIASLMIAAVQTTLIAGCTTGKPFTFDLLCDTCISYMALPFMNLATTIAGVFSGKNKSEKKGTTSLKIVIGVAISLPVVLILIMIFASADRIFAQWVADFIRALNINPLRITADILFTLITMLYVMPLVVSLRSGYHRLNDRKASRRFFDPIITSTVLFASSVVYLVFVAVQFTYLFAGIGSLPKDLTLAEYSRRGFFELVFVIVVTTVIMGTVCMLTKNNSRDRLPVYVKIPLLIITASNAVIIVSAARRLLIYIGAYHLTASRFDAAVLIALMAVVDLVVALRIIFDKIKVSAVIGTVVAMTAAAYCIFNADGFIAKYNIDRYLENPTVNQIDVDYMAEHLSCAAVPQLERLMNNAPSEGVKTHARLAIARIADRCELFEGDNQHFARWTLDRQIAVDIIDELGVTENMVDEYFDRYYGGYSYHYGIL